MMLFSSVDSPGRRRPHESNLRIRHEHVRAARCTDDGCERDSRVYTVDYVWVGGDQPAITSSGSRCPGVNLTRVTRRVVCLQITSKTAPAWESNVTVQVGLLLACWVGIQDFAMVGGGVSVLGRHG